MYRVRQGSVYGTRQGHVYRVRRGSVYDARQGQMYRVRQGNLYDTREGHMYRVRQGSVSRTMRRTERGGRMEEEEGFSSPSVPLQAIYVKNACWQRTHKARYILRVESAFF